jgi:outer membrane receptor protein involved in Fe transport
MNRYIAPLIALAAALSASAQTNDALELELPVVEVTAARAPNDLKPLSKMAANVSVIDRDQIASSPSFTLGDLLRTQSGFALFDTSSGFGAHLSGFGLRGFGEKAGTLVLIDGVVANEAGGGGVFWNAVPLDNIERVEIIRGGAATVYGAGAVGGVINIVTRDADERLFGAEIGAAGGGLGYNSGSIRLSGTTNRFDYRVTGSRQEWSGWRDFSHYRDWTTGTELGVTTAIGRFAVTYDYHTEYSENPGVLTGAQYADDPKQAAPGVFSRFAFDDELHRGALSYSAKFENGWQLNASLYHQNYETDFITFSGNGSETSSGGFAQATYDSTILGRENSLTFGAEGRRQTFTQGFGSAPSDYDSTTLGSFVKDSLSITPTTTLSGALRFDHHEAALRNIFTAFPAPTFSGNRENSVWSPNVSLIQQVARETEAWVSYSQSYRFPSYNDVISATPIFVSNPGLIPLNARTVEGGIRTRADTRLSGSLAVFHSWIDNDIFTDPALGFGFSGNSNNDAIRQGVELSLNSRISDSVELFANTAYINATFDGGAYDGNRQVLVPEWQFVSGMNLRISKRVQFTLENLYLTGQVRVNDAVNGQSRNLYNIVNARLAYRARKYTAFLAINNLLNRSYEQSPSTTLPGLGPQTLAHNPAPGLSFQIGMKAAF